MARKASSYLYRLARKTRDLEVLSSVNPRRIARRAKNKLLGRRLSRIFRW